MSFTAVMDISTFIWCEKDFYENKNQYIVLKNLAPSIYTQIKELKLPVLLRDELFQSIMIEFPYNMVEEIGYDFQKLTLEFLTDTFSSWILYSENDDNSITSNPELKKAHFSNNIKAETQSQVCHFFYNGQNPEHKFITYNYFFNQSNNLFVNKLNNNFEIDTLRYNSEKEIIEFFEKYRIKFEHNPKHRAEQYYDYERNENISAFSCYHKQGQAEAQRLLEDAFLFEGNYYHFDLENNVYIRYIKTNGLIYHGHDLVNEGNNIPNKVKKYFSK